MNKNKQIFELYIDYLVTSFSYTTSTGLSDLLGGDISHDQITRFLSHKQFSSADLRKYRGSGLASCQVQAPI